MKKNKVNWITLSTSKEELTKRSDGALEMNAQDSETEEFDSKNEEEETDLQVSQQQDSVFEYAQSSSRYVNLDNNTVFKTRILKKTKKDEAWRAEAVVVREGKELSRVEYNPVYNVMLENYGHTIVSELLPSKGFGTGIAIIKVNFSYGACDVPEGDALFTWDGKSLHVGPQPEVINSADYVVATSYSIVLPSEAEGQNNCLAIKWKTKRALELPGQEPNWSKATETVSYTGYTLDTGKLVETGQELSIQGACNKPLPAEAR